MWIIIVGIVIVLIFCYSLTSKSIDNSINNFEQDKWCLIGMFADMNNKKQEKK